MADNKRGERPKVKKKTVVHDPRVSGGKYLADRVFNVDEPQKANPRLRGALLAEAQDVIDAPLVESPSGGSAGSVMPGFIRHVNPDGALGGFVADGVTLGKDVFVGEGVVVRRGQIGDGVVLNGDTTVDIDGMIGSYSRVTNSKLTGSTTLGDSVLVEDSNLVSTQVRERCTIGKVDATKSLIEHSTVMGSEVTRSTVRDSGIGSNCIIEDSDLYDVDAGNVLVRKANMSQAFAHNCDILYSEVTGTSSVKSMVGGDPSKPRMKIEGNSKVVESEVFDTMVSSSSVNRTYAMSSKVSRADLDQCDLERSVVKGNLWEDVSLQGKTLTDRYVTLGTSGNALVSPRKQVHPFFDNR